MKKKLTIVGAGISGLYLAYLLEDAFEITILEARDRIGGRVFSIDGHDMGPSWIWSHHKQMLRLINKFGLKLFTQYTQGYALYDTKDKVELFTPPPSAPSARVNGSLSTLIEALYRSLKDTKLLLSQEVKSVIQMDEKVVVKTMTNSFSSDLVILTLPPRLASKLKFYPQLPEILYAEIATTPTWMGHTSKCVIEFKTPFWREKSLSGFVFSYSGPLGEIHDASTAEKHALFGFVSANANMNHLEDEVKVQLIKLFKIDSSEIVSIHFVDWRAEKYTASMEDTKSLGTHPVYGIETYSYSDKILFSATEFSFEEGGYLEGALLRAQKIVQQINEDMHYDVK